MSDFSDNQSDFSDNQSDFSDTDSAYDITDVDLQPLDLHYAYDDGVIEDSGITSLIDQLFRNRNQISDSMFLTLVNLILQNLVESGFSNAFANRVDAILKNYMRICSWILNGFRYSFDNFKQADDPLNNFTTFNMHEKQPRLQRGIWRWLNFTKDDTLELILAVPPRHWAFGKSAAELPIPDCVETLTSNQFHETYQTDQTDQLEYSFPPIYKNWWFIVIHPFTTVDGTSYNTIDDILSAVYSTNLDISHIKHKDVITISRLKDIININCDILNEFHHDAIGHEYKDRLHRRPNKRTRERRKRKLIKHGYTPV
jgi:hypothetical protein